MQQNNPYAAPGARVDDMRPSGEKVLAERVTRLGAVIIDGLIGIVCVIPLVLGSPELVALFSGGGSGGGEGNAAMTGLGVVLLLGVFIVNLVLLARNGQTLGKKALGIKIVRKDGSAASLGRIFWLRMVLNGIIGAIPLIGPFYQLADALFIFGEERRCLHDRIADTIVIVA